MASKPLRLWPGVVGGVLVAISFVGVPLVVSGAQLLSLGGGVLGGLLILIWWLLFSRAPWSERLGAVAVMVLGAIAIPPLLDASITGAGMGRAFYIMTVPIFGFALVVWAVATRALSPAASHR